MADPFAYKPNKLPDYGQPVNQSGSTSTAMGYNPTYNPPATSKVDTAMPMLSGAATLGVGLATGGTGWLVMGGIQLLGGLLNAFSKKDAPRILSPQEEEYNNMIQFYRGIGARSAAARAVASVATGTPVAKLAHIGPSNDQALDMTMTHFDTIRNTTAAKVTGGSR